MKRTLDFFHQEEKDKKKPKLDSDVVKRIMIGPESWVDQVSLPEELHVSEKLFEELWALHPEKLGVIKIYGKEIPTPRWQQPYGHGYYFSGMMHPALPYPHPFIKKLLAWCQEKQPSLNGALINWYADGAHSISPHSDDESTLVPGSSIYSFSFGAEREFVLEPKSKDNKSMKKEKIVMKNNTLLVMGGKCQKTHKHSVPKDKECKRPRINVTFRSFID